MIAIAAVAVLMTPISLWPRMHPYFKGGIVLAVLIALLVAYIVEFSAFAINLWHGPTRPRQHSWKPKRPFRSPEPNQSGEAKKV